MKNSKGKMWNPLFRPLTVNEPFFFSLIQPGRVITMLAAVFLATLRPHELEEDGWTEVGTGGTKHAISSIKINVGLY